MLPLFILNTTSLTGASVSPADVTQTVTDYASTLLIGRANRLVTQPETLTFIQDVGFSVRDAFFSELPQYPLASLTEIINQSADQRSGEVRQPAKRGKLLVAADTE